MSDLTLRSSWPNRHRTGAIDDYEVFDGEQGVGRIYRTNRPHEKWFWGAKLNVVGVTMRGHAPSLEKAKARFKAAYLEWKGR